MSYQKIPRYAPDKVALIAYDVDNDEQHECFCIKLADKQTIVNVFTTLYNQRMFGSCRIIPRKEIYRLGYVNRGWMIRLYNYDHGLVPLADFRQYLKELSLAHGYQIDFIAYNDIINLKAKYYETYHQRCS